MTGQLQPPANDRFKAEMPQIPGVAGSAMRAERSGQLVLWVAGGLGVVLVAMVIGGRLLSKSRRAEPPAAPVGQIDVPVDAGSVPDLPVPVARRRTQCVVA